MDSVKIELPAREEMHRRLLKVDRDRDLQGHFYPRLIARTGRQWTPRELAERFSEDLDAYSVVLTPSVIHALERRMEAYFAALLDDHDQARQVWECFVDIRQSRNAA